MKYYSTNRQAPDVSLAEAVIKGLAPDNGLYMPEKIPTLPSDFFNRLPEMTFPEMAFEVSRPLFGADIPADELRGIVDETLTFPTPLVKVEEKIYALELFHGPTLAFKDVGARFMARMLGHFLDARASGQGVDVLVATSGDTGSAVANGFLDVPGIRVHVLYPKGKVSPLQEVQFTTLGHNITALEVDGTFDDCQALVKQAFLDRELNGRMLLTSANSINVARFLPQMFYYFNAYAQLVRKGALDDGGKLVFSVPSGNFGNITAGILAMKMGLPVERFIAAGNANRPVADYLLTGSYAPRPSIATLANAMDVGSPSNFARILDIFGHSHAEVSSVISATTTTDREIAATIGDCYARTDYLLDPHGATAYRALLAPPTALREGETGVFLATAHPAKFKETVEAIIGPGKPEVPARLARFAKGEKKMVGLAPDYPSFRKYLLSYL